MLKTFLTPLLTLIIGAFLSVLIIQPAGAALTRVAFVTVLNFVYEQLESLVVIFGCWILARSYLLVYTKP